MNPIRILHLEDDPADAELIQAILESEGMVCRITRLQTGDGFAGALHNSEYDIILADYKLPAYDGMCALRLVQELHLETPFVFVSGTIGEDAAVEGLREGATDYVLKQKLSRLVPAVRRALHEAEDRRERRRAEDALRRSDLRNAILNQIANILLTMRDDEMYSQVLDVVLRAVKSEVGLFGFIAENGDLVVPSLTRTVWDICAVSGKSTIFPVASWGESILGKAIREKKSFHADELFHTPEGHVPIFRVLISPVVYGDKTIGLLCVANGERSYTCEDQDLLDSIARYISPILNARLQRDRQERERKLAEDQLKTAQRRFLAVLDGIESTIYVADMETHEILFMNKYMKELFGRDLTGEICWKALMKDTQPCSLCNNKHLVDENNNPTGVHTWGGTHPVTGRANIYHDSAIKWVDGRMVRIQIATDITQLKELEAREREYERRIQMAQKMEAIGTLAGGIAHDFNNILTAILGFAELVQGDLPEGALESRQGLDQILTAGLRAKDLVQHILTFSRHCEEEKQPLRISLLVKEAIKFLRASLPASIEIRSDLTEDGGVVFGDATQIHQVVMNLCTNAAHAMKENGGVLHIRLETVVAAPDDMAGYWDMPPGKCLRLTVSDTGHGIPGDIVHRIFDPFFTTKERGEGTGMGLSVLHGIVKEMGGGVRVESEPGRGTTFEVFLPIQTVEPLRDTFVGREELPKGVGRILFVDDEESVACVEGKILERLGYQVTVMTRSLEALELFKSNPQAFDLVVTDLNMPAMSGIELSRHILATRPGVPIVLCTGFADVIVQKTLDEIGIHRMLMKPMIASELAKVVKDAILPSE